MRQLPGQVFRVLLHPLLADDHLLQARFRVFACGGRGPRGGDGGGREVLCSGGGLAVVFREAGADPASPAGEGGGCCEGRVGGYGACFFGREVGDYGVAGEGAAD